MSHKQTVFRTEWFSIEQETFDNMECLRGKPYYTINSADSVLILALTELNEIILVRQFRPSLNQHTLELPAGGIDPSESPETAAARELYEETGFVCRNMNLLAKGRIMMSRHNSRAFAFFGTGARRDPGFSAEKGLEAVPVSPAEFKRLALSGEFEQFASFALLVLADWKFGRGLLGQS